MQEIFQHTERIKKEVTGKIAEQGQQMSAMKDEYKEVKLEATKAVVQQQQQVVYAAPPVPQAPQVSVDDLNTLKKMIFEMKEFTMQTDGFVRTQLLTKLEINNTAIEDFHQSIKNLNNKHKSY